MQRQRTLDGYWEREPVHMDWKHDVCNYMCGTCIELQANGCARTEDKELEQGHNLGCMDRAHDTYCTPHIAVQNHCPQCNGYRHDADYRTHCIGNDLQDHGDGGTGHSAPNWRE